MWTPQSTNITSTIFSLSLLLTSCALKPVPFITLSNFLDGSSITYWNSSGVSMCRFSVDGTPIRQFKNHETKGIPYPENQPMWIFSSLWDAEDCATRGGLVKTDWTQAPFTASYKHFNALACTSPSGSCSNNSSANSWFSQSLDNPGIERIKWVQKNYMIYNYCTDSKRFPNGFPPECSIIWYYNWTTHAFLLSLITRTNPCARRLWWSPAARMYTSVRLFIQ